MVLWSGDVGGAEVLTVNLAEQMRRLGVDASIVLLGDPEPLCGRLAAAGIPWRSLGFARGRDVLRCPRRYARALTQSGPDGALLVECGFMGAALRAGGYGGTIIATEHGAVLEAIRRPWSRRLPWELARIGGAWADDGEVAVSEFVAAHTRRHPHARVLRRIYNGIDLERRPPAREPSEQGAETTVAFASRLILGKGHDVLIGALALSAPHHRLRLRIAGEGPERTRLEALAGSLGIAGRVEFLGLTHDMDAFWAAAEIAAVPSAQFIEACPMTPLEAMAAGLPVIATRNGGLPEIVLDRQTGLLVNPGDPRSLARALDTYGEDPSLRRSHGRAGRARVSEHFHIAGCARAYLDLFAELTVRRRR